MAAYTACSRSASSAARSPVNAAAGPGSSFAAATRSPTSEDRKRANTASLTSVSGVPWSSADATVHFPVPFCPALSRIESTHRLALCVTVGQDVAGDLDEVRFQDARVPPPEDGAHLVVAQAQRPLS